MKKIAIVLLALVLVLTAACSKKKLENTTPGEGAVTAQFLVEVEKEGDTWRYALGDDALVDVLTTPEESADDEVADLRFWITGKAPGETALTLECTDQDGNVLQTMVYRLSVAEDLTVTVRAPGDQAATPAPEKAPEIPPAVIPLLYDASVASGTWSYALGDEALVSVQVTADTQEDGLLRVNYALSGKEPGETTFTLCCVDQAGTVVESRPYRVVVERDLSVTAAAQISFLAVAAEGDFAWDYELTDVSLAEVERDARSSGEAGALLPVTYTLRGLHPGEAVLTFRCSRPWAPLQVTDLRRYKISVDEDLSVITSPMDLKIASVALPQTKGAWMVASAGGNAWITLNEGSCSFFAREPGESVFLLLSMDEAQTKVLDRVSFSVSVGEDGAILAQEVK